MAATYAVEWFEPGILLLRRTGLMSVDEANDYAATAARVGRTAPPGGGALAAAELEVPSGSTVMPHLRLRRSDGSDQTTGRRATSRAWESVTPSDDPSGHVRERSQ